MEIIIFLIELFLIACIVVFIENLILKRRYSNVKTFKELFNYSRNFKNNKLANGFENFIKYYIEKEEE